MVRSAGRSVIRRSAIAVRVASTGYILNCLWKRRSFAVTKSSGRTKSPSSSGASATG